MCFIDNVLTSGFVLRLSAQLIDLKHDFILSSNYLKFKMDKSISHKSSQLEVYSDLNQALNINLQNFDIEDAIPDLPRRSNPPIQQHMDILPPGALKHKFPYPDHDEHMRLNG